jgi:hypothetical protein
MSIKQLRPVVNIRSDENLHQIYGCIRCKMVVKSELEKLGLHYKTVELGEAEIMEDISPEQMDRLSIALKKSGWN